jgi:hypothetical protein
MRIIRSHKGKIIPVPAGGVLGPLLRGLWVICFVAQCQGQGSMTLTFEGQPRGTQRQVGPYYEGGLQFLPIPMGALYLSGGGIGGYPDNATGYLYAPDNGMRFATATTFPAPFDLISLDAARYDGAAPPTLVIVGYPVMADPVTNYFTVVSGSADFQTFHPDPRFVDLLRVDIYASFSLDNLVVGGVPEPSTGALLLLAAACAVGRFRMKRNRP